MGLFDIFGANKKQKKEVKISVVSEAFGEIFTDCSYDPDGAVERETIRDTGLLDDDWNAETDSYNTDRRVTYYSFGQDKCFEFRGNDHFTGKYLGREIEFSDIDLTKYTKVIEEDDDGKKTEREESETCFKGIWLTCRTDKPITGTVRIREKQDRALLSPLRMFGNKRVNAKNDIETENSAFNEQFQILTNVGESAFFILTPHFMEHILSADNKADGRIMLCFTRDKVHIAVDNGKDSFEVKKSSDVKDTAGLKLRIQGEIGYLTGILDELFQNESLFNAK
jgi:hypothetical protein